MSDDFNKEKALKYAQRALVEMKGLNDWQQAAIVLLAERKLQKGKDRMTYDQIADELSISHMTLYRFRQRHDVKQFLLDYNLARLIDSLPDIVDGQVERAIKRQDTKAAELLLKYAGVLVERRVSDVDVTTGGKPLENSNNDDIRTDIEIMKKRLSELNGGVVGEN